MRLWQLQAGSSGRPRAFGCRAIYNHKASVSGRSLREVFRGGVCGHRAGPALLSLTTACAPIGRAMDKGPAALTFALHGGPVGGDGAQGEKIGLPGSASHTVSGGRACAWARSGCFRNRVTQHSRASRDWLFPLCATRRRVSGASAGPACGPRVSRLARRLSSAQSCGQSLFPPLGSREWCVLVCGASVSLGRRPGSGVSGTRNTFV